MRIDEQLVMVKMVVAKCDCGEVLEYHKDLNGEYMHICRMCGRSYNMPLPYPFIKDCDNIFKDDINHRLETERLKNDNMNLRNLLSVWRVSEQSFRNCFNCSVTLPTTCSECKRHSKWRPSGCE